MTNEEKMLIGIGAATALIVGFMVYKHRTKVVVPTPPAADVKPPVTGITGLAEKACPDGYFMTGNGCVQRASDFMD